jgi:hypothetical protein
VTITRPLSDLTAIDPIRLNLGHLSSRSRPFLGFNSLSIFRCQLRHLALHCRVLLNLIFCMTRRREREPSHSAIGGKKLQHLSGYAGLGFNSAKSEVYLE